MNHRLRFALMAIITILGVMYEVSMGHYITAQINAIVGGLFMIAISLTNEKK